MLRINERPIDQGILLEPEGDLRTPYGAPAFYEAVARSVGAGHRLVCADLLSVRNADAAGLGALLRARSLMAAVGGELQLIEPTGKSVNCCGLPDSTRSSASFLRCR